VLVKRRSFVLIATNLL